MKVRLEIIDDDGTIIESSEFTGRNWKKRLLGILDDVADENATINEPSSISSNSKVPATEQSECLSQVVQQQSPSDIQQNAQQPVQQIAPAQQLQPVRQQQAQPVYPQQQYQQPVQQAPLQQGPQYQQTYAQQPVMQNYQPQYVQPNLPPVGQQQYGYGQPAQQNAPMVHPPETPNVQNSPAVPHPDQQLQHRTPRLQERMNESLTINERLELFLRYEYPRVWFSSQDIQQHYERVYGTIKQSTVSTYLSRMYRKNLLERRGNRTQREYRYIADEVEPTYRMEEVSDSPVYHRLQY